MNTPTPQQRRAEARRRFATLMKITVVATLVTLAGAFYWLHATGTPLPLHFIIAVVVAVVGSLALAAALMGLVFFSNASGTDEESGRKR